MDYYIVIKRNKILIHLTTLINLQGIIRDREKASPKKLHTVCFHFEMEMKFEHVDTFQNEKNFRNEMYIFSHQELGGGEEAREK